MSGARRAIATAKLTDSDVRIIRLGYQSGETCVDLAKKFHVHHATISRIARRVWRQEVK